MSAHKLLLGLGTAVFLAASGIGLPAQSDAAQPPPGASPALVNQPPPIECNAVGAGSVNSDCGPIGTGPGAPPSSGTPAPPGTVTLPPGGNPPPSGGPIPIGTGPGGPSTPAPPSTSPTAPTMPPLSSAEVASEIASASSVGGSLLTKRPTAYMDVGGEKDLGTVRIANDKTSTNVNRLVPNTADTSYLTSLKNADDGKDMLGYKSMYDQVKTEDYGHTSPYVQARTTAHNSTANKAYTPAEAMSDSATQSSMMDIGASKNGTIMGSVFGACSTSTVTGPPTTVGENNVETCTKVQIPGAGGPACTRYREATATQTYLNGADTASLDVDDGYDHEQCTRSTTVTFKPNTPSQSKDANLPITTETGGVSCERQITASVTSVNSSGSASGDLPINTEVGGHACTRTVTVHKVGGTESGSETIPKTASPMVVSIASKLPAAVIALLSFSASIGTVEQEPTLANGWTAKIALPTGGGGGPGGPCGGVNSTGGLSPDVVCNAEHAQTAGSTITLSWSFVVGLQPPVVLTQPTRANGWNGTVGQPCPAGHSPGGTLSSFSATVHWDEDYVGSQSVEYAGSAVSVPMQVSTTCTNKVYPFNITSQVPGDTYTTTPAYIDNFNPPATSTSVGVSDSGNCGNTGDATCPTKWTCKTNAPTTYDGIPVSTADTAKVAPLFPGASSSCAVGSLDGVCGGSATTTSTISIATDLPPGITMTTPAGPAGANSPNSILAGLLPKAYAAGVPPPAFSNFTWKVTNPQPGVTVTLIAPPSASNGWVAQFQVTRTNFTYVPVEPHIVMSWTVSTSTVHYGKGDTGDCGDPGSPACPTQWKCTSNAPTTIDGYPISAAVAAEYAPLFPGATSTCVAAQLDRVCDGSSTMSDTVPIGDVVPPGTKTINNFTWTVQNPQSDVTVTLVSPPTYANGWTATFKVTRAYTPGGAVPAEPNVYLTWVANAPPIPVVGSTDNGDCSPPAPGGACTNQWKCTEQAPATIDGIVVNAPVPEPLFPGANPPTCLAGELDETCSGTGATTTSVSIASKIYAGDTAITNFAWSVTTAVPNIAVTLVQTPSLANNWVAIFQTTRSDWATAPAGKPAVTMTWKMKGPIDYTFKIVDNGNCNATSNSYCSVSWACNQSAPVTVDGLVIPPSVVEKQPALFTGDGGACMKATLSYSCSGVWDPGSHQVCWINSDGQKQCYTVPPSSTPPDTCGEYETNPQCHIEQQGCVAGAEDSSGWCYVMSYEYVCVTEVKIPGDSHQVTTCNGTQPCLNGSCQPTTAPKSGTSDMAKSTARRVFENTIETDWTYTGPTTTPPNPNAPPTPPPTTPPITPPTGPIGPGGPGGPGGPIITPPKCPTGQVLSGTHCVIP